MKPASTGKKLVVFGIILGFIVVMLSWLTTGSHSFVTLPIFGPKEVVINDKGEVDTLYHTVPDFAFIDHRGQRFTSDRVQGKDRGSRLLLYAMWYHMSEDVTTDETFGLAVGGS